LRIFAGNVDLKATFKTVAISPGMVIGELLQQALMRFKVPNAVTSEYYISVIHGDSRM